ncbi:hypothetical protein FA15DRAFT_658876 [Coprinopsis marcescibilis]|uniref:Uncharacterized protein n=1 Tax=Coprinopsis marcescibilis TaxID=230819 RepID=A0A5C3KK43_COPMA|nr:hypothetical protein FA15DRAFT_658876 [Coprinopsis marcescibilis]
MDQGYYKQAQGYGYYDQGFSGYPSGGSLYSTPPPLTKGHLRRRTGTPAAQIIPPILPRTTRFPFQKSSQLASEYMKHSDEGRVISEALKQQQELASHIERTQGLHHPMFAYLKMAYTQLTTAQKLLMPLGRIAAAHMMPTDQLASLAKVMNDIRDQLKLLVPSLGKTLKLMLKSFLIIFKILIAVVAKVATSTRL